MRNKILILLVLPLLLSNCSGGEDDILGNGSFEATEVLVSSEVNGKVLSWEIEEGSHVSVGDQVGLIDTVQLFLQRVALEKSGTGVRAARPNVTTQTEALQVQIKDLKDQRQRVSRLLKGGVATQKQLDDINTAIASLESQLVAARSSLSNSSSQITAQSSAIDAQIAQVEDMIERSIIRSPISGIVTASYIHAGELAAAGRPLFRVADLDHMYLRAYVVGSKLSKLKLGEQVYVYVDGVHADKRRYSGVVTWISSKAEFTPKTVRTDEERSNLVYAVKVQVQNDGYLRMGMYGEVALAEQLSNK